MARLIDADVLIKNECGNCDGICEEFDAQKCLKCTDHCNCQLRGAIEEAPTIESEPVRHGQWEHLAYNKFRCTACERASYVETVVGFPSYEYCPHCGARMDKKSPENHKKYQEEETNKKAFK